MKGIITIAGYGTRFLPASKAIPKEMIPIAGKPLIQYHVGGLVAAGITEIIVVVRDNGDVVQRHFSPNLDLQRHLESSGKLDLLAARDFTALKRKTKLVEEDLAEVVALIQSLNPRPGASIATEVADYVIPEEFETSVGIFSQVLEQFGVQENQIEEQVAALRSDCYRVFRVNATQDDL